MVSGQGGMANYEDYCDDARGISTTDEPITTKEESAPQKISKFV